MAISPRKETPFLLIYRGGEKAWGAERESRERAGDWPNQFSGLEGER